MTEYFIGHVKLTGYEFGVLDGIIETTNEEYDKVEADYLAKARELANRGLRSYARKPMKATAVRWDGSDDRYELIKLLIREPVEEIEQKGDLLEIYVSDLIYDVPVGYYVYRDQRGELHVQCPENFEALFEEVND